MRLLRRDRLSALALLMLGVFATSALAGNNPDVKVAVHVMPHDDLRTCSRAFPEIDTCGDIVTTYAGCGGVDIFPVFFEVSEYMCCEYGLAWPGPEMCTFNKCSDLWIGDITESGDGIAQAWLSCQAGPVLIPGFAWIDVSGPGFVCVSPHPESGMVSILDCSGVLDQPFVNCCAGLCGENGDKPCGMWPPSMGLDKTDNAGSGCVNAGDTLRYTITYENYDHYYYDIGDIAIVDYLPDGLDYVSASDGGTYEAGGHTVTWQVGTVPAGGTGSVEVVVRLRSDLSLEGAVLNTCEIRTGDATMNAAWYSSQICYVHVAPTTWGEIKSLFR